MDGLELSGLAVGDILPTTSAPLDGALLPADTDAVSLLPVDELAHSDLGPDAVGSEGSEPDVGVVEIPLDPRITVLQSAESTEPEREQAFADIFHEFYPICLRIARRILRDPRDAEESASQALMNASKYIGYYRPNGEFRSWIGKIAQNAALNSSLHLQKRQNISVLGVRSSIEDTSYGPYVPVSEERSPDQQAVRAEFSTELTEKLRGLHPKFLRALLLSEAGFRNREIAEMEGIPEGTVLSRIWRAKRDARAILGHTLEDVSV